MNRNYWMLALIVLLVGLAAVVVFSDQIGTLDVSARLGLDLRGGLQALLEVPQEYTVKSGDMAATRQILEQRANGLGVSEVTMQLAGDRRIVAEFPGVSDPAAVVAALKQTALLEFVDMGTTPAAEGTEIKTDNGQTGVTPDPANGLYHTVMTGADLKTAVAAQNTQTGAFYISFTLAPEQADFFSQYTKDHVGQTLGIALDKKVISAPRINSQISGGSGIIEGSFTRDEATKLAINLHYGSLPVPVQVVESRSVGPTLGAESVRKSLIAGLIGLTAVMVFMALYYRVPGLLADVALICYTLLTLALFELIPVVLTLPGIAGFILSIGMAVDANILIFERMKEELRAGRPLRQAIDLGWSRAWPSIRDANISTLITCLILFWFGNAFGASLVKGFALTLAIGVGVSMFTAIVVTRTFLHLALDSLKLAEHPRMVGLQEELA
jgi:preprotein translocase subunit SecD